MSVQSLENYNRRGTVAQPGDAGLRERNTRFLPPQNVAIRLHSRSFANSPQARSFTWRGE